MKRLTALLLITLILCTLFSGCKTEDASGFSIVAASFPAYDFAKNITGDTAEVSLLLPPGGESHTYEPTAKDIIRISECDIFIYNGGESDTWVEGILESLEKKPLIIKMMDFVDVCKSEHHHHGHDHEIDEHIWTSVKNSVKIVSGISDRLCEFDKANAHIYEKNTADYTEALNRLDGEFERLFASAKTKTIVVADRFPFTYFAEDYGLSYYSAYHSCTEDAEPTPQIIAELIDAVKRENIPIIFHLEFSNMAVASAVSEDTGARVRQLHSCHNVTRDQLENGITYYDLMKNNYEVLKEAVNL